jgi:aspartate kinase
MIVYKFGGASVKDSEAVRTVSKILSGQKENLVVVISAMGKTTNLLETLVRAFFDKDEKKWEIFRKFKDYHQEIIDNLFFKDNTPDNVTLFFNALEERLEESPSLDYDYEYDQIVSFGEMVSTRIVSDYLNSAGLKNSWIDIRTCLRTDDLFRDASVDWALTDKLVRQVFDFQDTNLYITQGFIGSTRSNLTTTLGREGSDFTAAILGNLLDAESVSFWKDVPGILTGDPKKMDKTAIIECLSYREAVEMTHSGAKVIHPKTMQPLHNKGIPLYVKSFYSPGDAGTVIHMIDHKIKLPPIFIYKENQLLITFSPKDFSLISLEDISRVINFFLGRHIKITMMQQSAIDLSVTLDAAEINAESLLKGLEQYYSIHYNSGLTLITVRHYTSDILEQVSRDKDIYLEQHSRLTARLLVREAD